MDSFDTQLKKTNEYGEVVTTQYPISQILGLPSARVHELVMFEDGELGEIFLMERDYLLVMTFGRSAPKVGSRVVRLEKGLVIKAGEQLLGTIIDPLGFPLSQIDTFQQPANEMEIDKSILGLSERTRTKRPFLTGLSVVDMVMPLGKGQKELIIGDRDTGKTLFLLTVMKNRVKDGDVVIYAAIGRSKSDIKKLQQFLQKEKIAERVIMVVSFSGDSPSLIFLTPYSAMTVAEYFRDCGRDVVVILDDLSAHARFYREISLIAKRFPGRDSYPGDIFFIHARLIERAGSFIHDGQETSITCLPVAETVEGDLTGFIPTNLMGMTDGHIFLDSNIYFQGRRPAVNLSLSVTRVGRQTQSALLRDINHELTAFLTTYERMQNLSHFGAELTEEAKQTLKLGELIYEFFDQPGGEIAPLPVSVMLLCLIWLRLLDDCQGQIGRIRTNLINAYSGLDARTGAAQKKLIDELTEADNFDQMLDQVAKKKEELLTLCKANIK